MTAYTRLARTAAHQLGRLAHQWQCVSCGVWFTSDTPSQTCGQC